LQTRVYIGQMPDGRPGRWPPLVDEATWQRAQEKIAAHKHRPKQASGRYLLTGFLRCERCGARMAGWRQRNRTARYRCTGQQQGAAAPDQRCYYIVRHDALDAAVLSEVGELVEILTAREPRLQAELRRSWQARQRPDETAKEVVTVQNLRREADKARQRLTNAAVLLVDGTIDKAGYELLRDKAQADLDAAEAELARRSIAVARPPELPPLETVLAAAGGWRQLLAASDTVARRDVLDQLIRTVRPRRLGFDRYQVEVGWTPLGEVLRQLAVSEAA
jgi:hypothetical protein